MVFYTFPTLTNFIILMVNVFMVIEEAQVKKGC